MASKTDWFALMDADDISMKERIESQIKFINSSNIDNLCRNLGRIYKQRWQGLGMMKTGPTTLPKFNRI